MIDVPDPTALEAASHAWDCHVIVAGDLFRYTSDPRSGRLHWHQSDNVTWLKEVIAGALASNSDIRVGILDHESLGAAAGLARPAAGCSPEDWWIERFAGPIDPSLAERVRLLTAGRVIIGYELPPSLRALVEESAAALLGLEIAPVRFLDTLLLSADSKHEAIGRAIGRSAISDREVRWGLGLLKARLRASSQMHIEGARRLCLLALQLPLDRSLQADGRLERLAEHCDELGRLAREYDLIIAKPHPHAENSLSDAGLLAKVPGMRITTTGSYSLLASKLFDHVVSISSSLLTEATFFGIDAQRLGRVPPQNLPMIGIDALSGELADEIAAICGFTLPPLERRLSSSPRAIANILGFSWATTQTEEPQPVLGGLTPGDLPALFEPFNSELSRGLIYGWHPMEEWGVWSAGSAVLAIHWPGGRSTPLTCIITATLRATDLRSQPFEICCEGEVLASGIVPAETAVDVAFDIPPPIRPGPVQIWILCKTPFRPADLTSGASADDRQLGLGLSRLILR